MSLISIIVPVFNVEDYLECCIHSILCQTFPDYEVLLVDDGSRPVCADLCDQLGRQDPRIHVIHQQNLGLSGARNTALDLLDPESRFLCFVDSDDYIHPQYLQTLLDEALRFNADIACCRFLRVKENCFDCLPTTSLGESRLLEKEEIIQHWHDVETNVAWNKLYKKELFDALRYPLGKINEDEFIKPQLFDASSRIAFVPQELYYYRQRNASITKAVFTRQRMDKLYAIFQNIQFFRKTNRRAFHEELRYFASYYFRYVFQAMYELPSKIDVSEFERMYRRLFISLMLCPLFTMKYRYMLVFYFVSPRLCEKRYGASYRAPK